MRVLPYRLFPNNYLHGNRSFAINWFIATVISSAELDSPRVDSSGEKAHQQAIALQRKLMKEQYRQNFFSEANKIIYF
ncbi:hypothetical protein IQ238_06510 [Pleurocapsales cyanobacterium LEGE 06147]|nr:hypothetical protein [Pleurocapsales cyanobacterium LEGE 06147]